MATAVLSEDAVVPGSPQLPPRPQRSGSDQALVLTDDGKEDYKKKTSTISRLLRGVNLRRSGRKYTYKQHEGDLNASEITMSDEDRMQLMILVKEGKISMHQAVDAVKQFEVERRQLSVERDSSEEQGLSAESVTSDEICYTPETSSIGEESLSPQVCRSPEHHAEMQAAGARRIQDSKPRSGKLFSSPSGSPRKSSLGKSMEITVAASPKEKKRGIFSSPFSRRKSSEGKKEGSKLQSVERSPQTPRRGIAGILRGTREGSLPRHALPPLPPLPPTSRSGAALVQSSSFQHQQGDRGRASPSPLQGCRRSSESHIPLPPRSPGAPRRVQPVYRHPYDYENIKYLSRSDTDLGRNMRLVEAIPKHVNIEIQSKASGSDSGLYTSVKPQGNSHVFTCEAQIHLCDMSALQRGSHPHLTEPLPDQSSLWARSPKRHTPPSGTPPDSQSPKRLHVYMVPDGTNSGYGSKQPIKIIGKPEEDVVSMKSAKGGSSAEGSPVSTMDKDGSSSTMSLGSETSPTATMEDRLKKAHSNRSQIPRRRASSFSTGDEAMSSDSEMGGGQRDGRPGKTQRGGAKHANEDGRGRTTHKVSTNGTYRPRASSSHAVSTSSSHSSVSMEEDTGGSMLVTRAQALKDSSPAAETADQLVFRRGDIIEILSQESNGMAVGTINSRKGTLRLADVQLLTPVSTPQKKRQIRIRKCSRRPKPTTVGELLDRLDLQSLVQTFLQHGFETLELFSQLEEEDLNELQITDPEARTKLLTAAQMMTDSGGDSSSVSGMSNKSSSQSPVLQEPCDVNSVTVATGARESVSSIEEGTLKKECETDQGASSFCDTITKQDQIVPYSSQRHQNVRTAISQNGAMVTRKDKGHISRSMSDTVKQDMIKNGDSSHGSSSEELSRRNNIGQRPHSSCSSTVFLATMPPKSENNVIVINHKSSKTDVAQSSPMRTFHPRKSQVPTFMGASPPRRQSSESPKVKRSQYPRPSIPERTVSLTDSISCPTTPVRLRDACTQHGGSKLKSLSRDPSPSRAGNLDQLVCANPVSTSKVKTAHVRQISGSRSGGMANHSQTPPPSPGRSKLPKSKSSRTPVSRHDSLAGKQRNRRVSSGVESIVSCRLEEETIDMTQPPYTDQLGFCGIPPSLVDRYSEDLHLEIWEAAQALENCRIKMLQHQGRKGVYNEMLAELGHNKDFTFDVTSLSDFLVSLGIPMYLEKLISNDITTLPQLQQTSTNQLQGVGIQNEAHLHRLLVATERIKSYKKSELGSPQSATVSTTARVVDRV